MSDIEIPEQAVRDYLNSRFGGYSDQWTGRIHSAERNLAAAYPSIRRQVLEEQVGAVKLALWGQWAEGVGDGRVWSELAPDEQEHFDWEARRGLGLDGDA